MTAEEQPEGLSRVRRQVAAEAAGLRLDVYLARQPEIASRGLAKEWIQAGRATVDGLRTKPGFTLEAGQWVDFEVPAPEAPETGPPAWAATATAPQVLFEDPYILVVGKPAGLPSHVQERRTWRFAPSVAGFGMLHCEDLPMPAGPDRPGIVHRLDKDTTGVMVLARTEEAFHFLQSQFKARTVEKEYRAIAYGESRFDSDHVVKAIASQTGGLERMTVVDEGGKEATTYYEVVERFRGLTYFRCLPKTGRTHQIRVHMASVGHPLVGDPLYLSRRAQHLRLPDGAPPITRHCLHAMRLSFLHPRTHERMTFEAPLPEDMEALLTWLRK